MHTLFALLAAGVFLLLVLVSAMYPKQSKYSLAELRRRVKSAQAPQLEVTRSQARPTIVVTLQVIRGVLFITLVCLFVGDIGWVWGPLVALVAALLLPIMARLKGAQYLGKVLYTSLEPFLLRHAKGLKQAFFIFRDPFLGFQPRARRVYSRDDLLDIIEHSPEALTKHEQRLLNATLTFAEKTVADIMTPRDVIKHIEQSEFLGPLVLDELHALGHSRLPVTAKDLDHIVGVLHLRDLLSLDVKRSVTAEKAMEKKVTYIQQDNSLNEALAAFLKNRHHISIVVNDEHETVGLLTLEDTIAALTGHSDL